MPIDVTEGAEFFSQNDWKFFHWKLLSVSQSFSVDSFLEDFLLANLHVSSLVAFRSFSKVSLTLEIINDLCC